MITSNASDKIREFNERGLHYNLVADAVYKIRKSVIDPFGHEYMPYIVAALISFDMGRMMGFGSENKYDRKAGGFATRLYRKIKEIEEHIKHLANLRLDELAPEDEKDNIKKAYEILSSAGKDGLHQKEKKFHVGTTKVPHFLNPQAFVIIDSNAARAFRLAHHVKFRNTTQPGYSSDKYIECMEHAKKDILNYGIKEFCDLEKGIPIARIYDKLTFITGSK